MGRFRDINRAEELLAAKNKLDAWRKLDTAAKQAAYKASRLGLRTNRGSQVGYILPFGETRPFFFETKVLAGSAQGESPTANEENENALITAIVTTIVGVTNKRVVTTAPTSAGVIIKKARKIQFAKVKVQIPGTAQAREATSRFTGKKYRQTEIKSASCPFGALTGSETEQEAQGAVRTAILALLPTAVITFTPQGFVG